MELLAPAGNLSCALAAFDSGADAVYAGLKRFNARERTENFTMDEMSKLIAYAHKHKRKVYIAFNTLIKENELEEVADELAALEALRPDAVIVQDLGVVRIAREYFPKLVLHGSTQMGLHNSAGLAFAREMGLSRVILERQTTLSELEMMMRAKPPVELEIFVHGALCCCISGSCLLSSWLGGWSGNRGKCKQPCRRRYRGNDGNGFFLSAQDLGTLEILPQLMKTGITSFKIEGRLRRSDYVLNVVAAYRMVMDTKNDAEFREVLPVAKARLARTYGRKWSLGYFTKDSSAQLVKHDAMGVSGLLCGKVVSLSENGFTVLPGRPLYTGDMIRVQPTTGDEGPSFCITKMSVKGRPVSRANTGEETFIHADKEIPKNGIVYKIGERTDDYTQRIEALPPQKPLLDLTVEISREKCRVACGKVQWERGLSLSEAGKQPLQPERVEQEFSEIYDERWGIGSVKAVIDGNPFLPASVLKMIRKECVEKMFPSLAEEQLAESTNEALARFKKDYAALKHTPATPKLSDTALVPRGKHPRIAERCVIAREIESDPAPSEELVLPFYMNEPALKSVREAIAAYIKKGGRVIRITSLCHLPLLKEFPGIAIKTCMPLPVCNSMAVKELSRYGVTLVQGSLELGGSELTALAMKSVLPFEVYRLGRPVLLSTRAELPVQGKIQDSKGDEFFVERHGILTQVFPVKAMNIPLVKGADASFYDLRLANGQESDGARFNFDISLS